MASLILFIQVSMHHHFSTWHARFLDKLYVGYKSSHIKHHLRTARLNRAGSKDQVKLGRGSTGKGHGSERSSHAESRQCCATRAIWMMMHDDADDISSLSLSFSLSLSRCLFSLFSLISLFSLLLSFFPFSLFSSLSLLFFLFSRFSLFSLFSLLFSLFSLFSIFFLFFSLFFLFLLSFLSFLTFFSLLSLFSVPALSLCLCLCLSLSLPLSLSLALSPLCPPCW